MKRELAGKLMKLARAQGLSISDIARRCQTSRSSVRRAFDKTNPSMTLQSVVRVATAVGAKLTILVEPTIERVEVVPMPAGMDQRVTRMVAALDRLPRR